MLTFKREAVILVVLAFYFLVLDQQTQESRLQQLILLQHLKRSRRKRLILLQIALCQTRRVRRVWPWPRNQFWFETLLNGNFVEEWCKENFRISRHTFENLVSKTWSNDTVAIPTPGYEVLCDRKRMYLSSKPWLPTLTMPARRVNRTFTLVNFLLSWAMFTRVSVGVYTCKIFT